MTLVAVGIPSYNEADSISEVVTQIDQGLADAYGPQQCLIVNVDSDSTDDTPGQFLRTRTRCAKESLVLNERPRGKGRNILRFLELCVDQGIDAVAMVDADIKTVTPDWASALLGPILRGEADFVMPRYRRSPFEGSTTNHFAYPLVYGWYGRDLRQPIGGDFGLNHSFVADMLRQPISAAILGYGIDIFLSSHAAGGGWRIRQAELGRKRHKPGYHKFQGSFPKVAEAAIDCMQIYPLQEDLETQATGTIDALDPFLHYSEGLELRRRMQQHLSTLRPVYAVWLDGADDVLDEMSTFGTLRSEGWSRLLSAALRQAISKSSLSVPDVAWLLQPAFLLRAVTFWEDSVDLPVEAADDELLRQAKLVRTLLVDGRPSNEVDALLGRAIAQEVLTQQMNNNEVILS
jgi:hypothetical protein